jgi:hypothetical protein
MIKAIKSKNTYCKKYTEHNKSLCRYSFLLFFKFNKSLKRNNMNNNIVNIFLNINIWAPVALHLNLAIYTAQMQSNTGLSLISFFETL